MSLSVPAYDSAVGVVARSDGVTVVVEVRDGVVEIFGNRAGLRDLARWLLVLSDLCVPDGAHSHLQPGVGLLDLCSAA